jgi:glucose-1-phosphate cytidylyltransferase
MKVIILCGGLGTRAYPFTRELPKALMLVGGVPIVEQVMRTYAAHGFDEFVLALGYRKELIVDYFRERGGWKVACVDTGDDADTGTRVRRCLGHVGERLHVTYCDGLGDVDLTALTAFHERHSGAASVTSVPLRSQYGILETDAADRVTRFVEKPLLPGYWVNAGFFVFDRSAVAGTEGDNLERDILPALAGRGELRMFRHSGFWKSMDTYKDHVELEGSWAPYAARFATGLVRSSDDIPGWLRQRFEMVRGTV